jgi:hypothetical protein
MNLTKSLPNRPILSLVPMPTAPQKEAAPDSLSAMLLLLETIGLLEGAIADALNYCAPDDLRDVQSRIADATRALQSMETKGARPLCKTS